MRLRGLLCHWPSITEWEMHVTAQGPRLLNDLYCVEWNVKLYYTIPYHTTHSLTILCFLYIMLNGFLTDVEVHTSRSEYEFCDYCQKIHKWPTVMMVRLLVAHYCERWMVT